MISFKIFLVGAFLIGIYVLILNENTKGDSSSKSKGGGRSKNKDNFNSSEFAKAADSLEKSTKAMEKLFQEQEISKLQSKYTNSSSQARPVTTKLGRPL